MKCSQCVRDGSSKSYDSVRAVRRHYHDVHGRYPTIDEIMEMVAHE